MPGSESVSRTRNSIVRLMHEHVRINGCSLLNIFPFGDRECPDPKHPRSCDRNVNVRCRSLRSGSPVSRQDCVRIGAKFALKLRSERLKGHFLLMRGSGRASEERKPNSNQEDLMEQTERKPLFDLGQLVATPGALTALEKTGQNRMEFLSRHVTGDWGEIPRRRQEGKRIPQQEAKAYMGRQHI